MPDVRRMLKTSVEDTRKIFRMFRTLDRTAAAQHFIRGTGIEIGGLHNPLHVSRHARVRYVDRMTVKELREHYPEMRNRQFVEVDILDDGETLMTVPDESQDFVIANHFLEHCEDPLKAICSMARVAKTGGILFVVLPDKRLSFDMFRPVTPFEHLLRDHKEGPAWSRQGHFAEWVTFVERVTDPHSAQKRVKELMEMNYSIHYHVWSPTEMIELFHRAPEYLSVPLDIEFVLQIDGEGTFVLRKRKS